MRERFPKERFPTDAPLREGQTVPFVTEDGEVQAHIEEIRTNAPGTVMHVTYDSPGQGQGGGNA